MPPPRGLLRKSGGKGCDKVRLRKEDRAMSRLPRHLEHLRTAFNAEAMSAASYRAYADHAEAAGKPNLAQRWRAMAAEKDGLAAEPLAAAGKVEAETANLRDAIAEELYERELLYPRLIE